MSAALCLVLPFIYVPARIVSWGLTDVVSYPENPPSVPAWSARLKLAHSNLVENLIPFACLVLVAQAASVSTSLTVFGAALFFWSKVAHALLYALKVAWFRTIAHAGAVVGMALIFIALMSA
tara:strand:+ start:1284 stop:1649 length:366 start_codon:yes stop_codon:yes gene_type:complete